MLRNENLRTIDFMRAYQEVRHAFGDDSYYCMRDPLQHPRFEIFEKARQNADVVGANYRSFVMASFHVFKKIVFPEMLIGRVAQQIYLNARFSFNKSVENISRAREMTVNEALIEQLHVFDDVVDVRAFVCDESNWDKFLNDAVLVTLMRVLCVEPESELKLSSEAFLQDCSPEWLCGLRLLKDKFINTYARFV